MRHYWLTKTEPETFSWDTLVHEGVSRWDGVRNFQARNNLRAMKNGDLIFIYHSGKNPCIIGLAEVVREHYPDPTAIDGDWSAVDVKPLRKLERPVLLLEIKQLQPLQNMALVKNTRLSVQPVSSDEYEKIMELVSMG